MHDRINVLIPAELADGLAKRAMDLGITLTDLVDHILDVERTPIRRPTVVATAHRPYPVFCSCCGQCQKVFTWRNVARCDCPKKAASL